MLRVNLAAFSLLVNGDFNVTQDMAGMAGGDFTFQSPSKWRFQCNGFLCD